jgi:hypothetical protein
MLPNNGGGYLVSGGNVRITNLSLTVTAAVGTKVRAYRRITSSDSAVNSVILDTSIRYKKIGRILGGATSYLDIMASSNSSQRATQPASEWVAQMVSGDKIFVEGKGSTPLTVGTNATPVVSGGSARLTGLSGVDWSQYIGSLVVVSGTHA